MNKTIRIDKLESEIDLNRALLNHIVFIFKHSVRCPISYHANEEVHEFVNQNKIPVFIIDVIENRRLSREFAARFGIQHQSPQVVLFHQGQPAWYASHYQISRQTMAERIKSLEI